MIRDSVFPCLNDPLSFRQEGRPYKNSGKNKVKTSKKINGGKQYTAQKTG